MSDFDLSPRESGLGKPASEDSSSMTTPAEPDYKKKYAGMVRKFDETKRQAERLQEALDAQMANHEEELANVRVRYKDTDKRLKEMSDQLAAIQAEKETLSKAVAQVAAEKAARAAINEKFPGLKDMWDEGVLKSPTEFESPEAFESYLAKMHKFVGGTDSTPQEPTTPQEDPSRRAAGITPTVSTRLSPSKLPRSSAQIADEMVNLNTRDPNYLTRFQELETEMSEAMEAGR